MGALKKIVSVYSAVILGLNLAAAAPLTSSAESTKIVINEICAKNTSFAASDGNFYDWIELYNPTGSAVNIGGYGLSDNDTNPYKFTFPDNTVINSGERLIVFCDSKLAGLTGQLVAPMGLSTNGETVTLTNKDGLAVDTVTFGVIETNVTYGRVPDGSDEFAFMNMTPDAPNEKKNVITVDVPKPELSRTSGFYDSSFSLSISVPQDTTVYYTLDGSTPTTESAVYSSSISVSDITSSPNVLSAITDIAPSSWGSGVTAPTEPVDKAFIVNAIAVDNDGNVSDTVTGAYFIGYNSRASYYNDMKVISIVTDKENLFDDEKGIYVLGNVYEDWKNSPEYSPMTNEWEIPANYTQKGAVWEREASMQVFENGQLAHSQKVGLRIHGGATRSAPQKSFNVYARSQYGASKFEFDLFSGNVVSEVKDKVIDEYDSFMLRNGGNDGQYTRFRDKLNQTLVADRDMLTQGMEPCVVFINGEFWGHYEITEKLDEDFIDAHYNVGKSNVCIVKNQELDEGDEETFAEWEELYQWIKSADFTNEDNYRQLCEKIDIQSFIDYTSAEIYFNNKDWGSNNMAMWKSTKPKSGNEYSDGKWRFILFDTEYSLNLYSQTSPQTNSFTQLTQQDSFLSQLLKAAIKNEDFRRQFCTTFMDMANENFSDQRVTQLIDELSAQYHDVSVDTHDRFWHSSNNNSGFGGGFPGGWGGGNSAEQNYTSEVSSVRSFYQSRFRSITEHLSSFGSLKGNLANITVKNDSSMGSVKINTITPDFSDGSWSGKYYTDYPVVLSAEPEHGYRLAYWETSTGEKISSTTAEIKLSADMTVTAVYEKSDLLMGDVNLDGSFNVADVVLLQKWLLAVPDIHLEQWKAADFCEDDKLDVFDLCLMKRALLAVDPTN